ncbi:MAG: hypothetical protein JRI92_14435 [Deltaproteobacteria bacterium]|nr:hypothetical protein [Deltaproteobacteria bacterium]
MFETQFIISTAVSLVINLFYTILALIIKNGNLAASIFASTILIFVAVIVSFGLKG